MGTWDWDVVKDVSTWSIETEALHGLAPGTFEGPFAAFQRTIRATGQPTRSIYKRPSPNVAIHLDSIERSGRTVACVGSKTKAGACTPRTARSSA
jgi:hypothetical protein